MEEIWKAGAGLLARKPQHDSRQFAQLCRVDATTDGGRLMSGQLDQPE